jgi:hypothetical protein
MVNCKSISCSRSTRHTANQLDEPTTHLDLLHKVALFKLLKNSLRKRINAFCFQPMISIWLYSWVMKWSLWLETVVQDEPCNFISKGTFNTLFKDEHIIFDSNKGVCDRIKSFQPQKKGRLTLETGCGLDKKIILKQTPLTLIFTNASNTAT